MMMMATSPLRSLLVACVVLSVGVRAEMYSDIMVSERDEAKALEVKHEKFWQPVAESAVKASEGASERLAKLGDARAVLEALPLENRAVRDMLSEALDAVRRANGVLEREVGPPADGAVAELSAPADGGDTFSTMQLFSGASVFSGVSYTSGIFNRALQRFTGGGDYSEKLQKQVGHRQAAVTPLLRGAASASKGVLGDCRLAQKLAFDAMKYDIYNDGVPETPKEADDLADRIVAVAAETRRSFTLLVRSFADSIANDVTNKGASPASIAVQASLSRGPSGIMSSMSRSTEVLVSL